MKRRSKAVLFMAAIAVTLFILVGMTFAWFYFNESASIDFGSDITCETGQSLEISTDGISWQEAIAREGFSSNTVDISGDGASLYVPLAMTEANQPTGYDTAKAVDENGIGEFVELKLFFRSTTKMDVFLSGESYISPANPSKTGNIYGNFSRDYIAGATRLAVLDSGHHVKMVWAPNPGYELVKVNGVYSFNSNGAWETVYSYCNGTDIVKYKSRDYASRKFVYGSTGTTSANSGRSASLLKINPAAPGEYDTQSIILRIWFEGTDREASEALAGGAVKMKLKFTGINKLEPDHEKETELAGIAYDSVSKKLTGVKNGMSFSTDGWTWTAYTGDNLPALYGGLLVFFKYPETETSFETSIREIVIPSG